tara:strand:+ start:221 stop:1009 length:789 start_codon:yes stop_codon:yes gene_type:complete
MLGSHFYHERIRKSVAMFGSLFKNIYVIRKDSTDKVISQLRVPLSYAPSTSFLDRIRQNPDLDNDTKVAIKLPRMSFEIISLQYDSVRQLQKINNVNKGSGNTRNKIYSFTPYIIGFQLNVYTKTQEDALQIVEQILPYFSPQYSLTIKPFADYSDIKEDVPIVLYGVNYSDAYEGSLDQRRIIQYTLDFTMPANFYGPVTETAIIREAIVDIYTSTGIDSDGSFAYYSPSSRIVVEPNPLDASPDSDYGFTTTIYNYEDSA